MKPFRRVGYCWRRFVVYGYLETNYLLRLLSVEGMKLGRVPFSQLSFMPKVPLFIPRISALHISFYSYSGGTVRPRDLARLCHCNGETVRLFLRQAEKAQLLEITREPHPLIKANPVMNDMLKAMIKGQSQAARFWPIENIAFDTEADLPTEMLERVAAGIMLFSLISNDVPQQRYIFRSILRRSLSAFLVLAQSNEQGVSERWVREQFLISHESLRQYKRQMQDMGYVNTSTDEGHIFLHAAPALKEVFEGFLKTTCDRLNDDISAAHLYRDLFDNYFNYEKLVAE